MRVLQATTALQEQGQTDKADENSSHTPDLLRIELKINLLLDVVGRILASNQPRPPAMAIRFNALGATFQAAGSVQSLPRPGAQGAVEIFLRECVAEPLRLISRVASISPGGEMKVRFLPPGEAHRRSARKARLPPSSPPGCRQSPDA